MYITTAEAGHLELALARYNGLLNLSVPSLNALEHSYFSRTYGTHRILTQLINHSVIDFFAFISCILRDKEGSKKGKSQDEKQKFTKASMEEKVTKEKRSGGSGVGVERKYSKSSGIELAKKRIKVRLLHLFSST